MGVKRVAGASHADYDDWVAGSSGDGPSAGVLAWICVQAAATLAWAVGIMFEDTVTLGDLINASLIVFGWLVPACWLLWRRRHPVQMRVYLAATTGNSGTKREKHEISVILRTRRNWGTYIDYLNFRLLGAVSNRSAEGLRITKVKSRYLRNMGIKVRSNEDGEGGRYCHLEPPYLWPECKELPFEVTVAADSDARARLSFWGVFSGARTVVARKRIRIKS